MMAFYYKVFTVSVRVFKMDGVITNFQWANNGVMPNGYELQL